MIQNHRFKRRCCKTPLIFQMEATECGAASLAIICAYWGKHVSMEQMRVEMDITRDGSNAKNMKRAAEHLGLECHAYRKTAADLYGMDFPGIILWESCHFVVLEGFCGKQACINDPAVGRRRLAMDAFAASYGNVILTFRPTELFVKNRVKTDWSLLLGERLQDWRKNIIRLFVPETLSLSGNLLVPVLVQQILDGEGAGFLLAVLFLVLFVKLTATGIAAVRRRETGERQGLFSRWQFVEKMLRLPVDFYAQRYPEDLLGRVEADENVSRFLTGGLCALWGVFAASCCLIAISYYSPFLALTVLAGKAADIFLAKAGAAALSDIRIKEREDGSKIGGMLHLGIRYYTTLQATGAQAAYSSQLAYLQAGHTKSRQELVKVQGRVQAVSDMISGVFVISLLVKGMADIKSGKMTPGGLAACILLYKTLSGQIDGLLEFIRTADMVKADVEKVNDIVTCATDTDTGQCGRGKTFEKLSGRIECKDISFGYSRLNPPLITDFSLQIYPGEMIAVVGMSGSGKSTVSKLLSGLYVPWGGEIQFDGRIISAYQPDVLHASIAVVCQESMLFSGSVKDNITLWNTAILDRDVVEAAKDACIHDLITQKQEAYAYQLAESGANLSGGQKQRIEIARALAKNPAILIMDEATSALDSGTEKRILDNIRRRGCTCIMVAHRLNTVKNCDRIIVLKDGCIAESGTHTELFAHGGEYRRLIEME